MPPSRVQICSRILELSLLLLLPLTVRSEVSPLAADRASQVDAVFAGYDRSDSPGCALGVLRDGQIIYQRGYGMADIARGMRNTIDTRYDVGSVSKQFTAAAVLLLGAEGRLSLDDEVQKWLPAFPRYGKPITLRHLLHQTSGLRDYLTLFSLAGINFNATGPQDALGMLARQKGLNFLPGDDWAYSNSNYLVLGEVVVRVSGKSLAAFARERLFEPAGMPATRFKDAAGGVGPSEAIGYTRAATGAFQPAFASLNLLGAGGVVTSVRDLLQWDGKLQESLGRGTDLFGQMARVGTLSNGQAIEYAAGLYVDRYNGMRRVHHSGSWAGFRSELMRFPDQRLTLACLCNLASIDATSLTQRVADMLIVGSTSGPEATPVERDRTSATPGNLMLQPEKLLTMTGRYYSRETGTLARIELSGTQLRLEMFNRRAQILRPLSETRFAAENSTQLLEFASMGAAWQLQLSRPGKPKELLGSAATWAPSRDELAEFTGRYDSDELDASYVLSIDGSALAVVGAGRVTQTLKPVTRGVFSGADMQLVFVPDTQGRYPSFHLHTERAGHVLFKRPKAY